MTAASLLIAVILALLVLTAPACASSSTRIYSYSQEAGSETAQAGSTITYTHSAGGSPGSRTPSAPDSTSGEAASPGPGLAPAAYSEAPAGSGGRSTHCVAAGESTVSPCYGVVPAPVPVPAGRRPAGGPARPPVNPAVLAASVADRVSLVPGRIQASPKTEGLTGATSWFWLSPTPSSRSVSVSLAGESVTVTAAPRSVHWDFGDGRGLTGGPGVAYRPGGTPRGVVEHIYQTRCLPGDQGRDPYVLASCGPDGYTVAAAVEWAISYTATGPVTAGGVLPSRSTTTSTAYPVSEARAFLTSGGSG
jgi:hypothetical protein